MPTLANFCCGDMAQAVHNAALMHYSEIVDEYGIPFHEDNASILQIYYCPWCGRKLPDSKRTQWFNELEALGYDAPLAQEDIPEAYKSAAWRVKDAAPCDLRYFCIYEQEAIPCLVCYIWSPRPSAI